MRRSYVVEVLFTLILFTIFVLGAFFILLFGADGYRTMVVNAQAQEQIRISLAYVSTKVHQAPSAKAVDIETINGFTCLTIEEIIEEKSYTTVIYHRDGALWELFTASDRIQITDAEKIANIDRFNMEKVEENLVFTATQQGQPKGTLTLNPR